MNKSEGKKTRVYLILLFSAICIYNMFLEQIPLNNGLGWDGRGFYEIAVNGIDKISNLDIKWYKVLRIFPFIFYDIGNYLGLPKDFKSVIWFFKTFNFIFILLSVRHYYKTAEFFKLNQKMQDVGFILLFFTFPILKFAGYYPLLNDHFSFYLSLAGLHFLFTEKWLKYISILFLSLFTFPSLFFGFLLITFFKSQGRISLGFMKKYLLSINYIIYGVVVLICIILYYYWSSHPDILLNSITPINRQLLPVSVIILAFYLIYIVRQLFFALPNIVQKKFDINLNTVFLVIAGLSIMKIVKIIFLPMYDTGILSPHVFSYMAIVMPLKHLVSHFFYYGVVFVLILYFLKDIVIVSIEFNLGYFLFFAFFMIISLNTESRILINYIPFFMFPLLKHVNNKIDISKIGIPSLLFFQIVVSRFWLPINIDKTLVKALSKPDLFDKYPAQCYFINHGPWTSHTVFYLQLMCVSVLLCIILFKLKRITLIVNEA
jgi:hypothetical protein